MSTPNTDLAFLTQLQVGSVAEEFVKAHLKKKGWLIVPTSQIVRPDGKGPRAESATEDLILPDFDVIAPDRGRLWAEVKFKSHPTVYKRTNQVVHGIGLYPFRQYQRIADRTHTPVWLFIYEGESGILLSQDCAVLAPTGRIYAGGKMNPGGMIFWPREIFVLDAQFPNPLTRAAPVTGQPRAAPLAGLRPGMVTVHTPPPRGPGAQRQGELFDAWDTAAWKKH